METVTVSDFEKFIEKPPFPTFVQFETNTICNAECRFCPHKTMKRRNQVTSWSTILKIIDEAIPHASACCPFLMQEPLLEPRLLPILSNIKQINRHCQTTIFTNMAAMTETLARKIIESRWLDTLIISFYGPTKEIYNRLQPPLNWEKTKQNIKRFMEIRKEYNSDKPFVKMHYIALPELLRHYWQFHYEWINIVDDIGIVHYDDFHGDMPVLWEKTEQRIWGPPASERYPCPRLWSGINILCDGTVVPCCIDYNATVKLGNIHEKTLHEIWLDEPFREIREAHITGRYDDISLCKNCKLWRYQHPPEWNLLWKKLKS